jgi:hypothetical protein
VLAELWSAASTWATSIAGQSAEASGLTESATVMIHSGWADSMRRGRNRC